MGQALDGVPQNIAEIVDASRTGLQVGADSVKGTTVQPYTTSVIIRTNVAMRATSSKAKPDQHVIIDSNGNVGH